MFRNRWTNGLLDVRIDGLGRGSFAHEGTRPDRTAITKNKFLFLKLCVTSILSVMCRVQPALAHDPPAIQPTQLDFDASSAPKKCRDDVSFRLILDAWVPPKLLREDAERRLVVRIQSSSTGGKRADVSLIDGEGVVVAERHTSYTAKMECHKVLWETAYDAARVLGAFEPPPPKEPIRCPICPLTISCPTCPVCPTCRQLRVPAPIMPLSPAPVRFFAGLGGFVSSGIFSELRAGPVVLLGLVPFRRLPQVHLEWETSWTTQPFNPSTCKRCRS